MHLKHAQIKSIVAVQAMSRRWSFTVTCHTSDKQRRRCESCSASSSLISVSVFCIYFKHKIQLPHFCICIVMALGVSGGGVVFLLYTQSGNNWVTKLTKLLPDFWGFKMDSIHLHFKFPCARLLPKPPKPGTWKGIKKKYDEWKRRNGNHVYTHGLLAPPRGTMPSGAI